MSEHPHSPDADLDQVFSAMADPTRRAIFDRLSRGTATVGELAEPFDISLPAVSRHLKVLESAGLMEREIEGRVHHCRAVPGPLREAQEWIARRCEFWEERFDALRSFLGESAVRPSECPEPGHEE